ncbi:MAG: hypothetical protein GX316_05260 [Firmicutes bacterium]|nr:hypothetical protein [Bacillota bacterium]
MPSETVNLHPSADILGAVWDEVLKSHPWFEHKVDVQVIRPFGRDDVYTPGQLRVVDFRMPSSGGCDWQVVLAREYW